MALHTLLRSEEVKVIIAVECSCLGGSKGSPCIQKIGSDLMKLMCQLPSRAVHPCSELFPGPRLNILYREGYLMLIIPVSSYPLGMKKRNQIEICQTSECIDHGLEPGEEIEAIRGRGSGVVKSWNSRVRNMNLVITITRNQSRTAHRA
jgi:hypothetical protein